MNIKQVRYFLSVAKLGSLSAAAREHNISVQAVSKAMFDLEKNMPEPLFLRNHQGVTLTPFGAGFFEKSEQVSNDFGVLENFAGVCNEHGSSIKAMLCAPAFLHHEKAQSDIQAFLSARLHIEAEVLIGDGEEGMTLLEEGEIDTLITIGEVHIDGVDCTAIGTLPTGICVAKDHPLADRESVTIEEIKKYPILFSSRFDRFNESVLISYRNDHDDFTFAELDVSDPTKSFSKFYTDHALTFLVIVSSLGEMFPNSVTIPIAAPDHKPAPICFVTLKSRKTAAYMKIERLFTL